MEEHTNHDPNHVIAELAAHEVSRHEALKARARKKSTLAISVGFTVLWFAMYLLSYWLNFTSLRVVESIIFFSVIIFVTYVAHTVRAVDDRIDAVLELLEESKSARPGNTS